MPPADSLRAASGGSLRISGFVLAAAAVAAMPEAASTLTTLHGTAPAGGASGSGTVFSLTPAGKRAWRFKVLHDFCASCDDGITSYGEPLVAAPGHVFGTTFDSGRQNVAGEAYELVPAGSGRFRERSIFQFSGFSPSDTGNQPTGGFAIDAARLLFGTTSNGGAHFRGVLYSPAHHGGLLGRDFGGGTVFMLKPYGTFNPHLTTLVYQHRVVLRLR